jgi:hypothetical protein
MMVNRSNVLEYELCTPPGGVLVRIIVSGRNMEVWGRLGFGMVHEDRSRGL